MSRETFANLGLRPELLMALDTLGLHTPTPIQAQAIGPIVTGGADGGCRWREHQEKAALRYFLNKMRSSCPVALGDE